MQDVIDSILKEVFKFSSFREGQREIIENLVKKRDVLAVMPTGFGKSLCFYIPAILNSGITLVVSPLISLMQDQINFLKENGVKAEQINSSLTKGRCIKILKDAVALKFKILYISPERVLNKMFFEFLKYMKISMIVIDEAHCISKWGHDFRKSYIEMFKILNRLKIRPVFACFTATATKSVREDILKQTRLKKPFVLVSSFNRSNLFFDVLNIEEKYKINRFLKLISKIKNENIIVYCLTRKIVENIFKILTNKGYNVCKYHAGLSAVLRKRNQDFFINGEKNILVATNAFGMGVDKKDIRYIIHFNMPQNLENYYQEIGRAGRDGKFSKCYMFYSDYDFKINEFLISKTKVEEDFIKIKKLKDLKEMLKFCRQTGCYRKYLLKYFGEVVENCQGCGNCLRKSRRFCFLKKILEYFGK